MQQRQLIPQMDVSEINCCFTPYFNVNSAFKRNLRTTSKYFAVLKSYMDTFTHLCGTLLDICSYEDECHMLCSRRQFLLVANFCGGNQLFENCCFNRHNFYCSSLFIYFTEGKTMISIKSRFNSLLRFRLTQNFLISY